MRGISSQVIWIGIGISDHHDIHFKNLRVLYINFTTIKLTLKKIKTKRIFFVVVLMVHFVSILFMVPLFPFYHFYSGLKILGSVFQLPPSTSGKLNDHILRSTLLEHITVSYNSWTHRLILVFILGLQLHILNVHFQSFYQNLSNYLLVMKSLFLQVSQKEFVNTILP